MSRDSPFSPKVKLELAAIAQYRCVRPGCNRATHFYDRAQGQFVHSGAAAHDAPASPGEGGERSKNDLTPAQKKAYDNGAWLCRNCATLVDIAQKHFPLGEISRWQAEAGEANMMAAFAPIPASHISYLDAVVRADNFIKLTNNVRFEGISISFASKAEMDDVISKCFYLPPLNEFSSLFPHTVNVQRRMMFDLVAIRRELWERPAWEINEGYHRPSQNLGLTYEQRIVSEASHSRVRILLDDYFLARDYVQKFVQGNLYHSLLYLW